MILAMTKILGFDPSGSSDNSRSPSTFLSLSMPFLRSKNSAGAVAEKKTLSQVRLQLELSFQDVETPVAERLRHKIRAAREVKELWMLRSDVHQLVSRQQSQQEAAQRINALLPYFEGWIPAKSLSRI